MGGYNGFLTAILALFGPLMCVSYHAKLATIMKEKSDREHRIQIKNQLEEKKGSLDEEMAQKVDQVI